MKILCGTDFSEPARQAADAAAALAGRASVTLRLVHVNDTSVLQQFPTRLRATFLAPDGRLLTGEADRLRRRGATVREEMMIGLPDESLADLARREAADLIVVASLGQRAPKRWLLGSVAERTVERATVPTLVVRDAAPFIAWADGERPLRVFVAFNFTETAETALRWVNELTRLGPCEVIVGHVDWPPEERYRLGITGATPLTGNPPAVQALLEREVRARIQDAQGVAAKIRVEGNWGRPESRLAEMAREEQADLIVVGSHQYEGFERLWHASVSRSLLHHAPMSVVVVPRETGPHPGGGLPSVRRILVSTDFSRPGDHAIPYTYAVLPAGGLVQLVHVIPPWELPGPLVPHYQPKRLTQKQHKQLAADSLQKLRALVPAEAAARGITTEVEVIHHAEPARAICQAAERFGADLICLGSHGRSGLSKLVLGSVAQQVMTHSTRPLLVIRPLKG